MKIKLILSVLALIIPFNACAGQSFPDLLDINHISAKGRVQDVEYNPHNLVIDNLIANGKICIPYLIERLKSTKSIKPGVLDFWPYIEERHLALKILTDLFLDPTWEKTTVPNMCYDTILGIDKYPELSEWEILQEHFGPDKWQVLIETWELLWEDNQEKIYWDSTGKFFRIKGRNLELCK